ncbi:hypothetical protein B1B04_23985 [Lysinibacillus sp. KCTC 33748]|uniref:LPXTG cell wall anchor domain-containing protein n=1 Tax=unclassified Lysinibacillus TaxID=2636778 RepID=UPI0009A5F84D|nr:MULTISPECIES: LPXTG cell wall anchor domain-containing protein [unclassified Lysinibacillus]OXS66484.1 hypothetical protein B1B04_23985 [Lysinibacillus sp. KCTC 33748]SKC17526.1 LPXTG-motif cell wall anchor domain-containing protein [Lysinibacillus sp. AC-3]
MYLSGLPIPSFLPRVDESVVQMGNVVFIIFGIVCVLIGLLILLLNRKRKNKTQKIVGSGFLIVGLLSLINNVFQYLFWS